MRFTIIYFILVLSSLSLVGVFILRSFEGYHLRTIRESMDSMSSVLEGELLKLEKPQDAPDLVQHIVNQQFDFGNLAEVFVIDTSSLGFLASTAPYGKLEDLDESVLVSGLEGKRAEKDIQHEGFFAKDRVYPIKDGSLVIYIRYDLRDHVALVSNSKRIIVQAIIISIVMTSLTSALLSRSITEPIKKLTEQVKQLAGGNFNQVIDVSTDDEIGEFSKAFNYLISEINKRVDRLTEEKKKVETITYNIDEGLVAVTYGGTVIHANAKAEELLGRIDAQELLTLSLAEPEFETDDEYWSTIIERNDRYVQLKFAEFTEEQEGGLIVAIQDITRQQQIENMRRQFIADVSHELKTPLTSILSYTETVINSPNLPEESRNSFLEVVISEGERMTRLVKDLLYLSAMDDSDRNQVQYSEVDLKKLVNKCIENLQITADQKRQKIDRSEIGAVSAKVGFDQMEQLVINLISNAIKYSPEDTEIYVRLKDAGDKFVFEVEDHGIGISAEDLPRIFDRFFREEKARSRSMGGTGLGLSIAKRIVELHGGKIRARSEKGKGSTFTVVMPKEPTQLFLPRQDEA